MELSWAATTKRSSEGRNQSENVVYCITCCRCPRMYIGETGTNAYISEHLRSIRMQQVSWTSRSWTLQLRLTLYRRHHGLRCQRMLRKQRPSKAEGNEIHLFARHVQTERTCNVNFSFLWLCTCPHQFRAGAFHVQLLILQFVWRKVSILNYFSWRFLWRPLRAHFTVRFFVWRYVPISPHWWRAKPEMFMSFHKNDTLKRFVAFFFLGLYYITSIKRTPLLLKGTTFLVPRVRTLIGGSTVVQLEDHPDNTIYAYNRMK